jgi:catechol 2,3-dioxygenase-like lactoylglutathione lyase family enzyme
MMNSHLHLVTLGVADLERARKFYTEILGWAPSKASNDSVVFIQAGGVVLSLYPREALAEDASIPAEGSGFGGVAFAYNTRSENEVDAIISDLKAKGVAILKAPQKAFWGGYHAYFADPDGNPWEVAFNPFFNFDTAGNLVLE